MNTAASSDARGRILFSYRLIYLTIFLPLMM
jgi:hypothetical protein